MFFADMPPSSSTARVGRTMPRHVVAFAIIGAGMVAAQPRQTLTFDYGWRFRLGDPPDAVPRKCARVGCRCRLVCW